jgi:predicted Fe-S protein YdhL (DUF1289 family)
MSPGYPESPCVGVCEIGDDGYCEGCLRSLAEIAAWASMDEGARAATYERISERARVFEVTTTSEKED